MQHFVVEMRLNFAFPLLLLLSSIDFCSPQVLSGDEALNCARMAPFCADNTYRAAMQICCKGTCTVQSDPPNCVDRRGDLCPLWNARRRDPFCSSAFYPPSYKAHWCARTCNLCDLREANSLTCQQLMRSGWPRNGIALAGVPVETRSLEEIYRAALAEGGRLILYAGGDTADQQDGVKAAFEQRFPGMTLDVVVDYSKFHGPRIDYQLATGQLVPDAVQLQTLQDFPRWKGLGVLAPYRPAGWGAVYRNYRDPDGFYTGLFILAFSNVVNRNLVPEAQWPRTALDYLRPEFGNGRIATTYPNDDDAVLFWFRQVIDKYGWQWMGQFVAQNPRYVRGTAAPGKMVRQGSALVTMSTMAAMRPDASSVAQFAYPWDNDPFTIWAQYGGILRGARHPEAAKLYLNWILDTGEAPNSRNLWSVRTDVVPPPGFARPWELPNSSHEKFEAFMADRAAVERFKTQITLFVGEPKGDPSAGFPGMLPERALPH